MSPRPTPRRSWGLYPRKGVLAPGSDADICLIDPSIKKTLTMDDFHISDYSIWEGTEIEGWPVTTILRGKVMVEDGNFYGTSGRRAVPAPQARPRRSRPPCRLAPQYEPSDPSLPLEGEGQGGGEFRPYYGELNG